MKSELLQVAIKAVEAVPQVLPFLGNRARYVYHAFKHYPGGQDHDQTTHAGGGGGGSDAGGDSGGSSEGGGSEGGGGSGDSHLPEINNAEGRIRNITTHEESLVVDKAGNVILSKTGEAERVRFTDAELKSIKESDGAILTHNHPIVASLSNGDLEFAASYNLAEMRAVDSKYTYKITRPENGWPTTDSGRPDIKEIGKMKSTWKRVLNSEANSLVSSGVTDVNILNEFATHAAMEAVSVKFGVNYVRTINN